MRRHNRHTNLHLQEVTHRDNSHINQCVWWVAYFRNYCSGVKSYQSVSAVGDAQAQRTDGGRIVLFRPQRNAARMANGADRMLMPPPPEELFMQAVTEVVRDNQVTHLVSTLPHNRVAPRRSRCGMRKALEAPAMRRGPAIERHISRQKAALDWLDL